jgi:hypothetical protein
VSTPQEHRRHRETQLRQLLHAYGFEIIWLVVISLGIFLIFERLNIRGSLFAWLSLVATSALGGVDRLDDLIGAFLARITLSDAVGVVLVLAALAAIVLRVRWRVLRNPALTVLRCPRCDGQIHRVHRHAVDRLICLFVPVRRYRCANDECRWHGLRVGGDQGSGRASGRKRS